MADADITGLSTTGQGTPDVQGASFEDTSVNDRQALVDAHKRNVSLGLLAAGLATLGHRRGEGGMQAIGQGGLTGLGVYEQGEQGTEQEMLRRQQQQALQAYRQQEIGVRHEQAQATAQKGAADLAERKRHDIAIEGTTQEQRDIAKQNADTTAFRAKLDSGRVGLEGARLEHEFGAVGVDTLAKYRGTNVDKLVPLPPPEIVQHMPAKDANALVNDVIKSYTQLSKSSNLKIDYRPMGDGKIHKIVTDKNTGETKSDTPIGPVVPRATKPGSAPLINSIRGVDKSLATPSTPSPTTNATPTAAPEATPAPSGKPLVKMDTTKYKDGTFVDKKTGTRYIIKDGWLYKG